jgi:Glycosyltransferase family 9 (heptosyltransferase)
VQALIAQQRAARGETWLVARSAAQVALAARIDGLTGSIDETAFEPASASGRFVDLRDHPLQRDYWWGSPEFDRAVGPLSINDILQRICADFGIDADFSHPVPVCASGDPDLGDSVLFVIETDGPTKRWPAERFAAVGRWIRERGGDVRHLVRATPDPTLSAMGVPAMVAPTPGAAVDALTSCRAVVGIDTGLTHVAVQQGTPTLTLCRDRPVYFRAWPHSRVVIGSACVEVCRALERDLAYNSRVDLGGFRPPVRTCPVGTPCMDSITAESVIAALEEAW